MERVRRPFQGVWNIVRFNWHFYVIFLLLLPLIYFGLEVMVSGVVAIAGLVILVVPVLISLLVSFYVYDCSQLYEYRFLDEFDFNTSDTIVNINAGFDETSQAISDRFPEAKLEVFDFYNPERHTESSIKRARKAYPPFPGAKTIDTTDLPLQDQAVSGVFAIMSAHEIRDREERVMFLKEIRRVLSDEGRLLVVEHLRNIPNFLAYTIGAFHFFSKKDWRNCFNAAGLAIEKEIKITPFVSIFILSKNGTTS